ncbi:LysR family transcriptional regulator [Paenibacillus aurantiacus]|uniref:LysR family transcriptional regulator n=1 Tax=Paenibacillus aurantiacus TaxID=1936118 RepID=A0ABV5KRE6_9BACL
MTFQQMRYIVEIAKSNSISKAASALYVTQPSISKAIKELEQELGIVILDRNNKGVVFTKEGTELLFYARMLLEQMESVVYHFNKQAAAETTKLSISSQHFSFAIEAFARLMNRLANRSYELSLHEGHAIDVIEEVYSGKSMLGLLSLTDLNRSFFQRYFVTKSLTFTSLSSMRQHVFLRQEHPLAHLATLSLEQLRDYPYLTYQQGDVLLHLAEEAIRIDDLRQVVYVKDRGTMNDLLSTTDGYNLGTGCIVENFMNANIRAIPLNEGYEIQVGVVKRKDTFLTEEIATYIEFLSEAIEKSRPRPWNL